MHTTTDRKAPPKPLTVPWTVPGALIAAAGGAMLLAVVNTLVGFTPGRADVQSTADQVRLSAAHPALTETIVLLGFLSVFLLVPGVWAVTARLAARTPVLAGIGGWMMGTGYIASMLMSSDSLSALTVARTDLDPDMYGTAVDAQLSYVFPLTATLFGFGGLLGAAIIGVAILRQRGGVPAWLGWVLIAAEPVRLIGLILGIPIGPPLASLMIAVSFAGVILAVRRAARTGAVEGAGAPAAASA